MSTETAQPAHAHGDNGGHPADHSGHIIRPPTLIANFAFLVVMMILTVVISFVPLGPMNNVFALVIAISKAAAVVLIFMGVKWGTKLIWLWAALGFVWFLLMFGILSDYITREWIHVQGWQNPNWYQ